MNLLDLLILLVKNAFWAGIAATGFAVLFNVPRRTLPGCVICGALGHTLRTLMIEQFELNIVVATLVGAMGVGFLGMTFASYWAAPATIFTVSGVIPMVPGVFAYQTMLGLFDLTITQNGDGVDVLYETSTSAIRTALILAAISAGIITPNMLFKRRKPVV